MYQYENGKYRVVSTGEQFDVLAIYYDDATSTLLGHGNLDRITAEAKNFQQELAFLNQVEDALNVCMFTFRGDESSTVNEMIDHPEKFKEWHAQAKKNARVWALFEPGENYPTVSFECRSLEEAVEDLLSCGFHPDWAEYLHELSKEEVAVYKKVAAAELTTYLETFRADRFDKEPKLH